jgi:aspartate/methionine/tyrosine aminotransferase
MLAEVLDVRLPDAAFYLWATFRSLARRTTAFAQRLLASGRSISG